MACACTHLAVTLPTGFAAKRNRECLLACLDHTGGAEPSIEMAIAAKDGP